MPLSDLVFTIINYSIYAAILRWATQRFIIPYFVHQQADERAQELSLRAHRERVDAASVNLIQRQQFFTHIFDKFSRYIEHMSNRLRQAREEAAAYTQARQALYRERHAKIYEQHVLSCQYRALVPEVVASAERKLQECYRDERHVEIYFEDLMKRMREKK